MFISNIVCLSVIIYNIVPTQVDKNARSILTNINDCAVPFLSRAAVNLIAYDIIA